jgi:DNA repair exonuclease SbcCD ATPase subunit
MANDPPLAQRYLYGAKKRTTKAERAARTASARAAKDASGPSSAAMDVDTEKENASNPLSDQISHLKTALAILEEERERQKGLKRKLYDKQRYREKDAKDKRQKLQEATKTVREQEKTIQQYEKADTRHVEKLRVLNDQISGLKAQKAGYQKQAQALKARVKRIPARIGTAICWALRRAGSPTSAGVPQTYQHKKGGVISDQTRDCFTDLMALDHIPASRVASC